ncbi:hypothetical protein Nepgr_027603 [Nepenthes gracilis]|uniref:NAC domain-containing protein n=1 Tax=Nepenthes gracilis TaxID=150966 RepID=A0AAD3T8V5_NEPGR|nr:hypothetical protein Nepgr_027603 [Nepenthes gracilis]
MGLKEIGETLPPGFRFYPSDEELVCHYLHKKIANEQLLKGTLVEIDLHTCEPWQLPEVAKLNTNEWYFFSFRDRKYATGFRTNRATTSGYWKATGKDRVIFDPKTRQTVGMRKTLVFYKNRAPCGIKTGWIMHEFRLEIPHMPPKEDWVLCRVFYKSRGEDDAAKHDSPPPQTFDQTTACLTSSTPNPPSSPPPIDGHVAMPCGYQPANSSSNPNHLINHHHQTAIDLALLNPNFIQFLKDHQQGINHAGLSSLFGEPIDPRKYDHHEYGFELWDVGMADNNGLVDEAANYHDHDFRDMEFEDDDGGVVLL